MISALPVRIIMGVWLVGLTIVAFAMPDLFPQINVLILLAALAGTTFLFPGTTLILGVCSLILGLESFKFFDEFVTANFDFLGTLAIVKLIVIAAMVPAVVRHGIRNWWNPGAWACVFLLLMSVTISPKYYGLDFAQMVKSFIAFFLAFVFFSMNLQRSWVRPGLVTIALLPVISIVLGYFAELLQFQDVQGNLWTVVGEEFTGALRLGGVNIPPMLAYYCYISIFVCFYLALIEKRNIFFALAAFSFMLLVFTGTRTPSLAAVMFAGFVVLFAGGNNFKASTRIFIMLAGVAVLAAIFIVYWPNLEARFANSTYQEQGSGVINTSGRLVFWQVWWETFLRSPILGHGIGAGTLVIDLDDNPKLITKAAHNEYLRLLVDVGVVGLVVYLIGFIATMVREAAYLTRNEGVLILGILITYALYSLTDNTLTSAPTLVFTFAIALITANSRYRAEEAYEDNY